MAHECSPACHNSQDHSGKGCECSCGGKSHGQASQPVPAASSDGTVIAGEPAPPADTGGRRPTVHVVEALDGNSDGWWPHAVTVTRAQARAIAEDVYSPDRAGEWSAAPVEIEQHRAAPESPDPHPDLLVVTQGDSTVCYAPDGKTLDTIPPPLGRGPSVTMSPEQARGLADRPEAPARHVSPDDVARAARAHEKTDDTSFAHYPWKQSAADERAKHGASPLAAGERDQVLDELEQCSGFDCSALTDGERDLLASVAEDTGRYGLAGKLRWGAGGMAAALARQPAGSTRGYHGVRVDRAGNGEFTVHRPSGPAASTDPNLASVTLAAESVRGALGLPR